MTEQKENLLDPKDETLEVLNNSGFADLIDKVTKDYTLLDFESKSNIPIPIEKIEETGDLITTSDTPKQHLSVYLEIINDPESALEYSYMLTGTSTNSAINITNIDMLYRKGQVLEPKDVEIDSELLGQSINNGVNDKRNIYILGHTHPKITEKDKSQTLTNRISQEIKSKFGIKEPGLNLSIQDIYQLVSFKRAIEETVPEDSQIYLGVLMYDGRLDAVSIEDGKLQRTKVVYN